MKRTTLIMLMAMYMLMVYSQNSVSYIYETGTSNPVLFSQPQTRRIYGGSIINVSFEGGNVLRNTKLQNAVAKACHLWEEQMPTCYPLKIAVRMGTIASSTALARVETIDGNDSSYSYGKLYLKKWYMYPLSEIPDCNYTFDYFRDSPDVIITFTNRNVFDYSISGNTSSGKYDFVTVALQAFYKAVSLSSTDYLFQSRSIGDSVEERQGVNRDITDPEDIVIQSQLDKNTVVRYLGSGMYDRLEPKWFISFIAVGSSGSVISDTTSCTYPVISYQGRNNLLSATSDMAGNRVENGIAQYLAQFKETYGGFGNFVMLNDGTWRKFTSYSSIIENDSVINARQVDGHLIIKTVTQSGMNSIVRYSLYEYLPQKSTPVFISATPYDLYGLNTTLHNRIMRDNDEYMEVEIGFTNIEGCSNILVEQLDDDYPYPTYYYVSPEDSVFTAIMNRDYSSTFTLHYINSNGSTIGNPLVVDLSDYDAGELVMSVTLRRNFIEYDINDKDSAKDITCTIKNVLYPEAVKTIGSCQTSGSIDISDLQKGFYVVVFSNGKKSYSTKIIK